MSKSDKYYIKRCLKLAKKGSGFVSPNPLVGCVIVENDKIISESYHKKYGEFHAERNAILHLPDNYDFSNATIYINLEPCTHFGKTPPCCDLIISKKFKRVVFAMKDPNPLVAGNSIPKLEENNIEVKFGILEDKAKYLNRFFIKHIQTKMPFISLKVAQTLNGKISSYNYNSKWISNEKSRKDVHKLRSKYDAVLVGTNTIFYDKPNLDVRLTKGRNPKRILLDRTLKLPKKLIYNELNIHDTILITSSKNNVDNYYCEVIKVNEFDNELDLAEAFKRLGELGINSILVESGGVLSSNLLSNNLIDELIIYQTSKILGEGISLFDNLKIENPNIYNDFSIFKTKRFEDDLKIIYLKN